MKNPDKEYPHLRLLHIYNCIRKQKGESKQEASDHFNGVLWKSRLDKHEAIVSRKQNPQEYQSFVEGKTKEWIDQACADLVQIINAPHTADDVFRPGPAPVPAPMLVHNTDTDLNVPVISHPGCDSDDLEHIRQYINRAPEPAGEAAKIAAGAESFEDVQQRALEFTKDPSFAAATREKDLKSYLVPLESQLSKAQQHLIDMEHDRDVHAMWHQTAGCGRPARKQMDLKNEISALSWRIRQFLAGVLAEQQQALPIVTAGGPKAFIRAYVIHTIRTHVAYLLGELGRKLQSLSSVYRKSTAQYKLAPSHASQKVSSQHMVVHLDPQTVACSMGQCIELAALAEDEGRRQMPFSADSLAIIADRMRTFSCMTMKELFYELDGRPDVATMAECIGQLVATLPVAIADLHPSYQGEHKPNHVRVFDLAQGEGRAALYSLLASFSNGFDQGFAHNVAAECQPDWVPDSDAESEEEPGTERRGRPRVEDKYGEEFVTFIRTYVHSRGSMSLKDGHRLKDTLSAFTSPLKHIAEAATKQGFPLTANTVGKLFLPRKNAKNAVNMKRGVVEAQRASVVKSDAKWSERCMYSASQTKLIHTWAYASHAAGLARVWEGAVDEMKKTPIFISSQSRGRGGYVLVDEDGKAVIRNPDHDFPLAPAFSMSVSGVVECLGEPDQDRLSKKGVFGKVLVPTFRPSMMHAFIRSHRYHPGGAQALQGDIKSVTDASDKFQVSDISVLTCDNGGAYTLDSAFNHLCYGRLFRQREHPQWGKAALAVTAYGAGDSKYNWKIEQQWPQPRVKQLGKCFGRGSVVDPSNPAAGFESKEDALQHISDAAMREFAALLTTCQTAGAPWEVKAPTDEDNIQDHAIISACCNASAKSILRPELQAIRAEFQDIYMHMTKGPSCIKLEMCAHDNPCSECLKVIEARRLSDQPEWHPKKVLRLLAWNDFRIPHPELREEKLVPAEDGGKADEAEFKTETTETPAERALREKIEATDKLVREAVEREAFQEAALGKVNREHAEQELQALRHKSASRPAAVHSLPTTRKDEWSIMGPNPYKNWTEMSSSGRKQTHWWIPCKPNSQFDRVLACSKCRYVSKTQAEADRHNLLAHTPIREIKKGGPSVALTPMKHVLGEYTVGGLEPKCAKKAKKSTAPEAVHELVDGPAEDEEGKMDLDFDEVEGPAVSGVAAASGLAASVPSAPMHAPKLQHTEDKYKTLMPEACQPKYINIRLDTIHKHLWQVTYHHDMPAAVETLPLHKLDTLPPEYKGFTKNACFGKDATDLQLQKGLEKCLRWAWGKHKHFWGIERPAWTIAVHGELDD